jgi:hypothetical protein
MQENIMAALQLTRSFIGGSRVEERNSCGSTVVEKSFIGDNCI